MGIAAPSTLDEVLDRGLLRSVFQPIVDLETGSLFGYEALARGPQGTALEMPDHLFGAARAEDRLAELDAACQLAAVAGAERETIKSPLTLFVNVEPDVARFESLPRVERDMRGIVEL